MTANDIITEVRTTLVDTASPYHWADTALLQWLNDALQALYTRRPDCVVLDDDTVIRVDRPAPLAELADPVGVQDRFRPALVSYVLARAYETDSDEVLAAASGRAALFMGRFEHESAR